MKIKFKISAHQLDVWHSCLETCWMEPGGDSPAIVRLVYHALSNMLHKLKVQKAIMKSHYSFSIDSVTALAFVAHIQLYKCYLPDPDDVAIINQIIGIIDQKTK